MDYSNLQYSKSLGNWLSRLARGWELNHINWIVNQPKVRQAVIDVTEGLPRYEPVGTVTDEETGASFPIYFNDSLVSHVIMI